MTTIALCTLCSRAKRQNKVHPVDIVMYKINLDITH